MEKNLVGFIQWALESLLVKIDVLLTVVPMMLPEPLQPMIPLSESRHVAPLKVILTKTRPVGAVR